MKSVFFAVTLLAFAAPALAQDAKNGQKHFDNDGCWQCHGYAGQGSSFTGPRISRTELTLAQFTNQLRHPASGMPPYEAPVMADATIADIYAYLKGMPEPPDPKNLPLLQQMRK